MRIAGLLSAGAVARVPFAVRVQACHCPFRIECGVNGEGPGRDVRAASSTSGRENASTTAGDCEASDVDRA